MKKLAMICCFFLNIVSAYAEDAFKTIMEQHLKKYAEIEHISAIQASVKTPKKFNHYAVGRVAWDANSQALTPEHLFDIGSITKSFTAALVVMAETEKKLKLSDALKLYLEEYPHWQSLTLSGLLDMSTGIPNYSESPTLNYAAVKDLKRYWDNKDLVDLVYSKEFNPPLKSGYFYSNTGYVLIDMILNKVYEKPFKQLLDEKILKPLKLSNTFYPVPEYSKEILGRMAHGYAYNIYDNPELLGKDVTQNNLSWAGAAGALVATSDDVALWVDALFIQDGFLSKSQKAAMQQLISLKDGAPIQQTDEQHPRAFGLGIVQAYDEKLGQYWFYEGETLGYRALYLYVPCNKVIISAFFNSATNGENDHSRDLIMEVYEQLLKTNSELHCVKEPSFA